MVMLCPIRINRKYALSVATFVCVAATCDEMGAKENWHEMELILHWRI